MPHMWAVENAIHMTSSILRKGTTPDVYFKFETPLGLGDPSFGRSDVDPATHSKVCSTPYSWHLGSDMQQP